MDAKIQKVFVEMLNEDLQTIIISNSTQKEKIAKIKIRPILLKGDLAFQVSEYIDTKVFHSNYGKEEVILRLPEWFQGLFRQAELTARGKQAILLISKKGKATVKYKRLEESRENALNDNLTELQHNKKKNYILEEGNPLPFLVDLGIMTTDGMVIKAKFDKFRQINRFLEYIEDILEYLDKEKELTILDFGCGKSYLTFAMYYYLKEQKGYHINIIGLDLKKDVIERCNELSRQYGYEKLCFLQGDIASYHGSSQVDMVVTLHACDTATDYALYKAVTWNAKVILSVPCCQHEMNRQIRNDILKPVLKYGIVKERISALFTDALRAELLEQKSYRVQLLEFIDMEHTPKNILIRAVKRKNSQANAEQKRNYTELVDFLHVSPCLERLFEEEFVEEGN
jgi:SAM-dependent methyltransferase